MEAEANDTNSERNNTVTVKKEPTAREREIVRLLKEEQEHPELLDADNDAVWSLKKAQIEKPSRQCPYLDTIDRFTFQIHPLYFAACKFCSKFSIPSWSLKINFCRCALDFDFEKLCSVSLSHINVYACMVCGKYFQVNSIEDLL